MTIAVFQAEKITAGTRVTRGERSKNPDNDMKGGENPSREDNLGGIHYSWCIQSIHTAS